MRNIILTVVVMLFSHQLHAQTEEMFLSRKDTIYEREMERNGELQKSTNYVTTIQLGQIPESFTHLKMNFEYRGSDTTHIVRSFTSDPHYIDRYPKEPLMAGKTYPIVIRFYCRARRGPFRKPMGFRLANGDQIYFTFIGEIVENP